MLAQCRRTDEEEVEACTVEAVDAPPTIGTERLPAASPENATAADRRDTVQRLPQSIIDLTGSSLATTLIMFKLASTVEKAITIPATVPTIQ